MKQRSKRMQHKAVKPANASPPARTAFAGKPLDGSQYLDVVEEQAYADRRPTPEEQKPRFSFLNKVPQFGRK